jgi:hypothetical protein
MSLKRKKCVIFSKNKARVLQFYILQKLISRHDFRNIVRLCCVRRRLIHTFHAGSETNLKSRIRIPPPHKKNHFGSTTLMDPHKKNRCCGSGSGIRCFFDPWIRDPGWVKKSGSGSGMNSPDQVSESLETNFRLFDLKYLNYLMQIRDGKKSDPG